MILTVHNLAKTYKMLPSEALSRATTFDLYVLDTFSRYTKYQESKKNKRNAQMSNKAMPNQESLLAMLERAKKAPPMKRKERKNGVT